MTSGQQRFERATGVLSRTLGDEVLVTALGHEGVDSLRGAVGSMWCLLDVPRRSPDLVSELASAYGTAPEPIEDDVDRILDDLLARGWVQEVNGSDA